ncbi:MAG: TniQ family protein [Anaerolineae bacterium]|nr:TniQ family protein [Anaerolineae bacterium]
MTGDLLPQRPLLCRIPLLPGESLWSYLTRLAAANGYDSLSLLTRLCHQRLAPLHLHPRHLLEPQHAATFAVLAALGGLTPRELANASVHYFARAPLWAERGSSSLSLADGAPLPLLDARLRSKYLWREHEVRFCPECLQQAAYHRLAWTLKEVGGCLEHRRLLRDRCPNCAAQVSVQDVVRGQCRKCRADLAAAMPDDVLTPFDVFAQQTIRSWWGLAGPAPTDMDGSLPDQPAPILHQLFELVQDAIRAATAVGPTVLDRYNVQLQAFKALADWPTGFGNFLRGRLEQQVRIWSYYSGCDFSGPVHLRDDSPFGFWICGLQDRPGFGFVQEAVDRFLVANNIRVESGCRRTRLLIEADAELQRIARPLAEKGLERMARVLESMGEDDPESDGAVAGD